MTNFEPLNDSYDEATAMKAIGVALTEFYESLTRALDDINIEKILKRKNPYLYRARGIYSARQIIEEILSAYVSSSQETIFGNVFFEPVTLALSGGYQLFAEGIDIMVDKGDTMYGIVVKSGTSVNADSRKRQEQSFQAAQKRVRRYKQAFVPVVGYGYGHKRKYQSGGRPYIELAGQDFWHWLTGDPEFYTKIIRYMGTRPDEYAKKFEEAYANAENRLLREFTAKYCDKSGAIDWDTLVKFNSGN
ncbi:MAG: hypothetical protein IJQ81_03140 [Oscillibacter sp.]|nr:hypothetical protein [Oscillibacter sp.]